MKPELPSTPQAPQTDFDHADDPCAWLSALADGEAGAADRACRHWREQEAGRRTWHAYHMIGDVMRSEELACSPARDAAFLAGVRARLAGEPAVLAPQALASTLASPRARSRQPWLIPAAAAAGFAVVAGVLVASRIGAPGEVELAAAAPLLAVGNPAAQGQQAVRLQGQRDERLIRDAQLDEYLRAHQAARGGVAMAAPGGSLRRVDNVVPASSER